MMYITCTNSRFARRGKSISLENAVQAPLILPGFQHGVRPRIENLARTRGLVITDVIDINSIAILKSALLADMGATILPVAPLISEIERGEMIAVPIEEHDISRTVVMCASKNIPLTNAAVAVERLVLEVAQKLCDSGKWLGVKSLQHHLDHGVSGQ